MKKQKGKIGIFLEKYFLKFHYGIYFAVKNNQQYDLPFYLNYKSNKNVSIKSSKSNNIMCSDIFNFLSSKNLEMLIIFYCVKNNEILVSKVFILEKTELLFFLFNSQINYIKLLDLYLYIQNLNPPYNNYKRNYYKIMSKFLNIRSVLKINCKVSSTNKRIQCSFNFQNICKFVKPVLLYQNLVIKIKNNK